MSNRHLLVKLFAALLVVIGAERSAHAQATAPGFVLNRFEPSERGSEWFVADTLDLRGSFRPALGVIADYGYKPYVLLNRDGSENTQLVSGQMFVHLGGSIVLFDRLRLGMSIPLALAQEGSRTGGIVAGQRVVGSSSGGFGDLRIAADFRLLGTYGDAFTLAVGGRVWAPTGDETKLLGDQSVRIGPRLQAAGDAGAFAYAFSLGANYRSNDAAFAGHATGNEVTFGAAAGVRALEKKLLIGPEVWGSTIVSNSDAFFGARTTPLALLGSGHYTAGDFRFGLGAGPGLSHAAGTAAFRAVASIEWAPAFEEPQRAPPPIAPTPIPPPVVPPPPSDRDRDGVLDEVDACPDVPGIATDDPKTNGCPSDRDKDGILDSVDACPDVPGVRTDDPKTNGCPSDRDKDGILDTVDACPDTPGPANTDPKKNGCPIAYLTDKQIQITDQIKFRFGLAELDPASDPVLQAVLEIMKTHVEIKKVKVEGHTDNVGAADFNRKLSKERAGAVAAWMVRHGIDKSRIEAEGFGLTRPLEPNDTDSGRAANRRVEFHIEAAPK